MCGRFAIDRPKVTGSCRCRHRWSFFPLLEECVCPASITLLAGDDDNTGTQAGDSITGERGGGCGSSCRGGTAAAEGGAVVSGERVGRANAAAMRMVVQAPNAVATMARSLARRTIVDDHRERRGGDGLAFVDLHNVLGINLHRGVCATLIHPHHPLVARCRADDALIPQSTHRSPRTEEPVCSRGKVPSPPCKIRHGGEILTPHHEHTPRMELGCRPLVGRSRPASRSSFDES